MKYPPSDGYPSFGKDRVKTTRATQNSAAMNDMIARKFGGSNDILKRRGMMFTGGGGLAPTDAGEPTLPQPRQASDVPRPLWLDAYNPPRSGEISSAPIGSAETMQTISDTDGEELMPYRPRGVASGSRPAALTAPVREQLQLGGPMERDALPWHSRAPPIADRAGPAPPEAAMVPVPPKAPEAAMVPVAPKAAPPSVKPPAIRSMTGGVVAPARDVVAIPGPEATQPSPTALVVPPPEPSRARAVMDRASSAIGGAGKAAWKALEMGAEAVGPPMSYGAEAARGLVVAGAKRGGQMALEGAKAGGNLALEGAKAGGSMALVGAKAGGSLALEGAKAGGSMALVGAKAGGSLALEGAKMGGSALFHNVAAPLVTQALPAMASGAMQVGKSAVENILVPVVRETVNQVVIPGLQGAASAGIEAGRLSLEHGPGIASAVGKGLAVAGAEGAKVTARAGTSLFFKLTKLIEEHGAKGLTALEEGSSSTARRKRGSSPPQYAAAGPAMIGDMARAAPAEQSERSDPKTQRTQQTGLDSVMEFHRNAEGWKSTGKGRLVEQLASRPNFIDMLGPVDNPKKTLGQMNRNQLVQLLLKYDKAHGHI